MSDFEIFEVLVEKKNQTFVEHVVSNQLETVKSFTSQQFGKSKTTITKLQLRRFPDSATQVSKCYRSYLVSGSGSYTTVPQYYFAPLDEFEKETCQHSTTFHGFAWHIQEVPLIHLAEIQAAAEEVVRLNREIKDRISLALFITRK